jgi:hypothetical protein
MFTGKKTGHLVAGKGRLAGWSSSSTFRKTFSFPVGSKRYRTQPYPAGYLARAPERLYTGMALVSPLTPFMLRNVCIVLVLAALAATSAAASPVLPANARKLAHHKTIRATAQATHKTAARAGTARAGASHAGTHRPAHRYSAAARAASRRRSSANAGRVRVLHSTGRTPQLRRVALVRRRIVIPASPLKGSLESLTRQNERTEADGLERILDEQDLTSRIEQKLLVPVPVSASLVINTELPETHRYCRPWTASFLTDLAGEHAAQFHKPLIVSSAVRTVEYQAHLMRHNGNAAAAEGDVVSPHLTGGTVDIAKSGMSRKELAWMRDRLLALQTSGLIDVEEEFRQPCFHITVYKSYAAPAEPDPAPASQATTGAAGAVDEK